MRSTPSSVSAFAHHTSHFYRDSISRKQLSKWTCALPIPPGRGVWDLPPPSRSNATGPASRPRPVERRTSHSRYSDYREPFNRERRERYPRRRDFNREDTDTKREDGEMTEIREALASEDDLIYGVNPVLFALRSGKRAHFTAVYIQEGAAGERKRGNEAAATEILRLASEHDVPVTNMDKGRLNVLSGNRPHQGVVLRAARLEIEEIRALPRPEEHTKSKSLWLILDEVTDPQNAGALIRSAYFLGANGVALCKKNSTRITPVVSKASAGAVELCDVRGVGSLPRFLRRAKEDGWYVVGMAGEGGVAVHDVQKCDKTVVVVGSEGSGLRTLVRGACDALVRIDGGAEGVDSLNVGVAGGIALYELLKDGNSQQCTAQP